MLALGIADTQQDGVTNTFHRQRVDLNDRVFNAAMFYEFATGTKWCCSEE